MSEKDDLRKTLTGMGIPILKYPRASKEVKDGIEYRTLARDKISEPGFYLNEVGSTIEHWSRPSSWNLKLADHSSNELGLICDGYQSILPFNDVDGLFAQMQLWDDLIKRWESE